MKRRRVVVLPALVLMSLGACGASDLTLLVDDIDEAIAAVAQLTGRPARFYEINATPELINLFLDDGDGNAISFVWDDGKLRDETSIAPAEGTSFDASDMRFTKVVYARVEEELPDSLLRAFSVTADGPRGEILNRVVIQSERGGQFAVFVDQDGTILGSDPLTGPG